MFETNLRDERFLPFEGAGAESSWRLELPADFRQFDYNTIPDVILHLRYTARQGGTQLRKEATKYVETLVSKASTSGLALLFSLQHDFSNEWHKFVTGNDKLEVTIKREYSPYLTQGKQITIDAIQVHAIKDEKVSSLRLDPAALTGNWTDTGAFQLSLDPDGAVLERDQQAQVFILLEYSLP